MIIKEVYLDSEKKKIEDFLWKFDLKLDNDIFKTFYISDSDIIIGTISVSEYIIKDLAVDNNYQNDNIASKLISHVINYFSQNSIYNYQVFTKKVYKDVFISLGFKELIETDKLVMLEGGISNIYDELEKLKKQIEVRFASLNQESDLASIVINGNPITIGHEYLVEKASLKHKMVIVFIVQEDKSEYSFIERLSMAFIAFHKFSNVYVLPSTKYIISSLTFPTYFLKEKDISNEMALVDALIFKNYFMKYLFIKKRYVGTEIQDKMIEYNQILKSILQDNLEEIPRLIVDNQVVSASKIRTLIKENKTSEAYELIPKECLLIFKLASERRKNE